MKRRVHRGAALLAAMLTVTLVATFAAAAMWQQWRSVEVEGAVRMRVQAGWILGGALDWARLILREDARAGSADHLAEPWAVPLQEARLGTFLAADRNVSVEGSDADNIFLSGQITDLQGKLNVNSLLQAGTQSSLQREVFNRLFDALGLPRQQLDTMAANLQFATDISTENLSAKRAPLAPNRLEQLQWLGLAPETIAALEPHVTVLPGRTLLNLNTASAEAIYAAGQGIDMADAQKLVAVRQAQYFRSANEAATLTKVPAAFSNTAGVSSQFFEVRGRLRIDNVVIEERSILRRNGLDVEVITRERGAVESPLQPGARR